MSRRSCKLLPALSVPDVDVSRLAMRSLSIQMNRACGSGVDDYFVDYDQSNKHGSYFSSYFTEKYTTKKPHPRNAAVQVVMECKLFLDLAGVSQFLNDKDDDHEQRYKRFFEKSFDLEGKHKGYVNDFTPDMATLEVRWNNAYSLWQVYCHEGRHRAWWIHHKKGWERMVVMIGYDYSTGDACAASPCLQDVYREQADWGDLDSNTRKRDLDSDTRKRGVVDGYYGILSEKVSDPPKTFLKTALYQVARTTYADEFSQTGR
eukprot:1319331-Prymnesium_polylepis.1